MSIISFYGEEKAAKDRFLERNRNMEGYRSAMLKEGLHISKYFQVNRNPPQSNQYPLQLPGMALQSLAHGLNGFLSHPSSGGFGNHPMAHSGVQNSQLGIPFHPPPVISRNSGESMGNSRIHQNCVKSLVEG